MTNTKINGRPADHWNTADLQRNAAQLLSALSEFATLNPGDAILLGTPQARVEIQPGDRVRVLAEGFPPLENPVVYNALTSISPNAEVSLDNTQGLGRGNIANDGLLTLKNVTGELRNSISGKGIVSATARTDVELDGDNSRFVGQFNIDTGSALRNHSRSYLFPAG